MKKCPQCSKTFPDNQNVCLYDETALIPGDGRPHPPTDQTPEAHGISTVPVTRIAGVETDAFGAPKPTATYNPRETTRDAADKELSPVPGVPESIKSPSRYVTRPSLARPSDSFEPPNDTIRELPMTQAQSAVPIQLNRSSKAMRIAVLLLVLTVLGTGTFAYFIYDKFVYSPSYYTPSGDFRPVKPVAPDKIAAASSTNEQAGIYPNRERRAKEFYDNGVKHQEQASRLADAGLKIEADAENQKAIIQYREAIVADPRMAMAHENLGVALYSIGDFEGAAAEYESTLSLALAPTSQLLTNYGYSLLALKRFRNAADAFERALQVEPTDYDLHFYRGSALYFARDIQSARDAYTEYLRLAPKGQYAEQARDFLAGRSVPVETGAN